MTNPVDSDSAAVTQERALLARASDDDDAQMYLVEAESVERTERNYAAERQAARIKLLRSQFEVVLLSNVVTLLTCRVCMALVMPANAGSHFSYHEGERSGR